MLGCCLFDADDEVALLLEKNAEGWLLLHSLLGPSFFLKNDEIDKPKLRKAIFEDSSLREKIEGYLHPLVRRNLKRKADEVYSQNGKKSLIEVPLLYEVSWQNDFALVVVVSVSEQKAVERAMARDGVTVEQAKKTMTAQFPLMEKMALADHVIDNDKSWNDTLRQLAQLKKILTPEFLRPSIN